MNMKNNKINHLSFIFILWGIIILGQLPFIQEGDYYDYFANLSFIMFLVVPTVLIITSAILGWIFGFPSGKTFKIRPDCHKSTYRINPFINKDVRFFRFQMHEGFNSENQYNQKNKIVGMNWGLPKYMKISGVKRWVHVNSLRAAWSYNDNSDKINFYYYGYYNGVRYTKLITSMKAGRVASKWFEIEISKDVLCDMVSELTGELIYASDLSKRLPNWGYYLFPYFGGTLTSDSETIITIYKYDKKIGKQYEIQLR